MKCLNPAGKGLRKFNCEMATTYPLNIGIIFVNTGKNKGRLNRLSCLRGMVDNRGKAEMLLETRDKTETSKVYEIHRRHQNSNH